MTTHRFAILSIGRSGTSYFSSKLASLPGVIFAWEPFNQGINDWFDPPDVLSALPQDLRSILRDTNRRDRSHDDFYREVFSPQSKLVLPGVAALGFKLFPSHSPNLFWKVAADAGIKIIVIERRNRFDTFASYFMSIAENSFGMTEFNKKGVLNFDPIAFDMFVEFTDAIFDGLKVNLALNKVDFIHLYYEDFTTNEDAFVQACEFIGVPYQRVDSELKKQITIRPEDLFANKQALSEHLRESYPTRFTLDSMSRPPGAPEAAPASAAGAKTGDDTAELRRLRAMLAEQNAELVARAADAFHHDQRADALQTELAAVTGSTSWRMTAPLRGALHGAPRTARLLRRAAKLV